MLPDPGPVTGAKPVRRNLASSAWLNPADEWRSSAPAWGSVPRSRAAGARYRGGCVRAGLRAHGDRCRNRAVGELADPGVRAARPRRRPRPTPPSPLSSSTGTGWTGAGSRRTGSGTTTGNEKRFGGPYFGIHRADIQRTLSDAFGGEHLHPRLPAGQHRPGARLGRGWSSPTAVSSVRTRRRRGRGVLDGPAVDDGGRRRRVPGPVPSAASSPSRTCCRRPTRRPFSSGWDRTATCCTTRSAATATR